MHLVWGLILNEHLYLSGEWLGVDLRTDTKKTRVENILEMQVHNILTILDTIISRQNLEGTDMLIQ